MLLCLIVILLSRSRFNYTRNVDCTSNHSRTTYWDNRDHPHAGRDKCSTWWNNNIQVNNRRIPDNTFWHQNNKRYSLTVCTAIEIYKPAFISILLFNFGIFPVWERLRFVCEVFQFEYVVCWENLSNGIILYITDASTLKTTGRSVNTPILSDVHIAIISGTSILISLFVLVAYIVRLRMKANSATQK